MDILYEGRDGFRPDGSAFHHGMHYFAYADYSMSTLCALLSRLGGTPFQVAPEALARVKTVILNMRFYCNRADLPLPLCGRHPHSQQINPVKLLRLAEAAADPPGRPDPELAAAYLRFHPEAAAEEPFATARPAPEPSPNGSAVDAARRPPRDSPRRMAGGRQGVQQIRAVRRDLRGQQQVRPILSVSATSISWREAIP